MSNFGAMGLALTGVAVNTVRIVHDKRDPFPALLAGTMFTGVCIGAEAFRPKLGVTIAAVFLLGSLMYNGTETIAVVNSVVTGPPKNIKVPGGTQLA